MSYQKQICHQSFLAIWLIVYNNASDDVLSLSASVVVNKQTLEVILMPGNNAILVAHQINAHYNTYAHDGTLGLALCKINTN